MLSFKKIIFPLLVVFHIVVRLLWADVFTETWQPVADIQFDEVAYQNFLHENPNITASINVAQIEKWQIDKLIVKKTDYVPQISLLVMD